MYILSEFDIWMLNRKLVKYLTIQFQSAIDHSITNLESSNWINMYIYTFCMKISFPKVKLDWNVKINEWQPDNISYFVHDIHFQCQFLLEFGCYTLESTLMIQVGHLGTFHSIYKSWLSSQHLKIIILTTYIQQGSHYRALHQDLVNQWFLCCYVNVWIL